MENNDVPKCKRHPDRPARIGKSGRSLGCCPECLIKRAKKANRKRHRSKGAAGNGQALVRAARNVPRRIRKSGPDGRELVFIPSADLVSPAKEIRISLVYTLTDAKIIRNEGR